MMEATGFDVAAQIARDWSCAERLLVETGSLPLILVVHEVDKAHIVTSRVTNTAAEKNATMSLVRLIAKAHDAVAVTVVMEAWLTMRATMAEVEAAPLPSDDPARREVVMVSCEHRTADGRIGYVSSMRDIMRGADGAATGLAPSGYSDPTPMLGRMTGLLPAVAPSAEERTQAMALLDKVSDPMVRN